MSSLGPVNPNSYSVSPTQIEKTQSTQTTGKAGNAKDTTNVGNPPAKIESTSIGFKANLQEFSRGLSNLNKYLDRTLNEIHSDELKNPGRFSANTMVIGSGVLKLLRWAGSLFLKGVSFALSATLAVALLAITVTLCVVVVPALFKEGRNTIKGFGKAFTETLIPLTLSFTQIIGKSLIEPIAFVLGIVPQAEISVNMVKAKFYIEMTEISSGTKTKNCGELNAIMINEETLKNETDYKIKNFINSYIISGLDKIMDKEGLQELNKASLKAKNDEMVKQSRPDFGKYKIAAPEETPANSAPTSNTEVNKSSNPNSTLTTNLNSTPNDKVDPLSKQIAKLNDQISLERKKIGEKGFSSEDEVKEQEKFIKSLKEQVNNLHIQLSQKTPPGPLA